MGAFILFLVVAVVVAGVLVTQALERRRAARIAAWSVEPTEDDDIIELDERDVWIATLPPPPPARAFHHHVHHAV